MRVILTQSPRRISIRIETSDVCTEIRTSITFDPYEELFIWLGLIRDLQLPATIIIDEEGRGVELIAEQLSNDLIQFHIEPWFGSDTATRLTTRIERYELLKAFHDGIVEFIRNEYRPSDWSYVDDLSNINWRSLLKPPSVPNQQWQERLAMYGGGRQKVCETGRETVWNQLTPEQQWLVNLRNALIEIAVLSGNDQTTQAQALANFYKNLPIDIVLGELDPIWYQERRTELETEYELVERARANRRRTLSRARLKTLKLGQIVDGTVRRVKPSGVFVDVGGYHVLLSVSSISQLPVEHPKQVFKVGDWVRAMIVWMDAERGRISLSTRDLEPESGDMLKDPLIVYEKAEEMAARYRELVLSRLEVD